MATPVVRHRDPFGDPASPSRPITPGHGNGVQANGPDRTKRLAPVFTSLFPTGRIATSAGLDDETTAHVLRHTFATTLVRGGTDLVIVAELLGHTRLDTTRGYTRPTAEDRKRALDLLLVDE